MDCNYCLLFLLLAVTTMTSLTTPGVHCDPVSGLTTATDWTDPIILKIMPDVYQGNRYSVGVLEWNKVAICQLAAKIRKGTDILVVRYYFTQERKLKYTTDNCKSPKTVDTYPCSKFVSIQCDPQSIVYLTPDPSQDMTILYIDTRYVTEHDCSTTLCDTISQVDTDIASLLKSTPGEGDKDNTTVIVPVIVSTVVAVVLIVVVVVFLLYRKKKSLISNTVAAGSNTGHETDPETDTRRHDNTVNNTEGVYDIEGMYDGLGTTNNCYNNDNNNYYNSANTNNNNYNNNYYNTVNTTSNNDNHNYYSSINTTSNSTNKNLEGTYYSEAL